ncbi:MAG: hypothetical protein IJ833_08810 [Lachnospiraceae bacterium]|nr:hypothetical protein [Lachnospiraceae bacterium]
MDLGYGFIKGLNKITKEKICQWLHTENSITWDFFVWYIADYFKIRDYGEDWVIIELWSERQREFLYKKSIDYEEEYKYNYEIDCANDLWKSHKRGAERNYDILIRLAQV